MTFEKRGLITSDSNVALAIAMGLVFGSIAVSIGGFLVYRWWMKQKAEEVAIEKETVALPEIEELPSFFSSKTLKRILTGDKRRSMMAEFDFKTLQKKSSDPSIPLSEIRMDMTIPEEETEETGKAKTDLGQENINSMFESMQQEQHHTIESFSKDSLTITMEEVDEPKPRNSNRFSMMPSEMQDYNIYAQNNRSPISPMPTLPLPASPSRNSMISMSSPVSSVEMNTSIADVEPQEKQQRQEQTHLASPPLSPVKTPLKIVTSPVVLVKTNSSPTHRSPQAKSPLVKSPLTQSRRSPSGEEDSDEDDAPLGANMSEEQLKRINQATTSIVVLPVNARSHVRRGSATSSLRYEL